MNAQKNRTESNTTACAHACAAFIALLVIGLRLLDDGGRQRDGFGARRDRRRRTSAPTAISRRST